MAKGGGGGGMAADLWVTRQQVQFEDRQRGRWWWWEWVVARNVEGGNDAGVARSALSGPSNATAMWHGDEALPPWRKVRENSHTRKGE
ncbi:hypothetical protein NL676_007319 [Syzygium grande]|nr:hypothetical protein NL676_007319 [Syzygium grande]